MDREVFIIKNISDGEVELKDFGYVIPSGETVELYDFNKATLSNELDYYLSGNTLVRLINGNIVEYINAYSNATINYYDIALNELYVRKSGATYNTIQEAINSVTDASSENPYFISIGSGIYTEDIIMKNYVYVQGIASSMVKVIGNLTISGETLGFIKIKDIQFTTTNRPTCILDKNTNISLSDVIFESIWDIDAEIKCVIDISDGALDIKGKTYLKLVNSEIISVNNNNYVLYVHGSNDINILINGSTILNYTYNDNNYMGCVYNSNTNILTIVNIENSIIRYNFNGLSPLNNVYNIFHSGSSCSTIFSNTSFECVSVSETTSLKFICGYNINSINSSSISILTCSISWNSFISDSEIYIGAVISTSDIIKVINTVFNTSTDTLPIIYTTEGNFGDIYYSIFNGNGTFYENNKLLTKTLLIGDENSINIDNISNVLSGNSTTTLVTEYAINNFVQGSEELIYHNNTGWTETPVTIKGYLDDITTSISISNGTGVINDINYISGLETYMLTITGGTGYINYSDVHKYITWSETTFNLDGYISNSYFVYVNTDGIVCVSDIEPNFYNNIYLGYLYYSDNKIVNVSDTPLILGNSSNRTLETLLNLGAFIIDNGGVLEVMTGNTLKISTSACQINFGVKKFNLSKIDSDDTENFKFVLIYLDISGKYSLDYYRMFNEKSGQIYTDRYNNINSVGFTTLSGYTGTFTSGSSIVTVSGDLTSILSNNHYIHLENDVYPLNTSLPAMTPISAVTYATGTTTILLESIYLGGGGNGNIIYFDSLPKIPTGKYVKHLFFRQLSDSLVFVTAQQYFNTYEEAVLGSLPPVEESSIKFIVKLAYIIVQEGDTSLSNKITDIRPLPFTYTYGSGGGNAGVTSHSTLTDLGNDDHLQYLRTDGTRVITDIISYNNNKPFTSDVDIISKKYADDNLILKSDSGHTHTNFNNNLTIIGDLVVSGTTIFLNTEELNVLDNMIYINSGETNSGVTKSIAGIEIDRGYLTNYRFVFDEPTETFRVGQIGSLQAIATREDTPIDGFIPVWNSSLFRLNTTINPNSLSLTGHTHEISDINNLQSTLDSKSNTGHTHLVTDIDNISTYYYDKNQTNSLLSGYTLIGHSHVVSSITDINTYYYNKTGVNNLLTGYSITGHTHTGNEISDLSSYTGLTNYYQSTTIDSLLDGKMNTGGTVLWSDIEFSGSTLTDIENRNAIDINYANAYWSINNVKDGLDDITSFINITNGTGRISPVDVLSGRLTQTLNVSGGTGYINYENFHKYITWSTQTFSLSAFTEGSYYVYINVNSIINISTVPPNSVYNITLGYFYYGGTFIGVIQQCGCLLNTALTSLMDYTIRQGVFIYDNGGNLNILSGSTQKVISLPCKMQYGLYSTQLGEISSNDANSFIFSNFYNSNDLDWEINYYFSIGSQGVIPTNRWNDITKNSSITITGYTLTFTQYSNTVTCSSDLTTLVTNSDHIYFSNDTNLYSTPISSVTWTGSQTNIFLESVYLGSGGSGTAIINSSMPKIPYGSYTKHIIVRSGDGAMYLLLGQTYFTTYDEAVIGVLPELPTSIIDAAIKIAAIVVNEGLTDLTGHIYDIRPLPYSYRLGGQSGGGGGVSSSHSQLTNLNADDHLQYLRTDGTRNILGIQQYDSHPSFSTDTDLIDKKYVDDNLFLKANSAHTHTSNEISNLSSYNDFTSYYLKTDINDFFSGTTSISGYNKTNWDSAYTNTHTHTNKSYLDSVGNNTIYHVGNINTNSVNLATDKLVIHTQVGASSIISGSDNGNISLHLDSSGGTFEINTYSSDNVYIATGGGNVAIGNPVFDVLNPERFLVQSYTDTKNIISAYANANTYIQLNIHNNNSGNFASSDIVATADNGSESDMYIDMGINSSTYNDPDYSIVDGNDSYLISNGGHLAIGTATSTKNLIFFTNGTTVEDEKMRIEYNGNIIIQNNLSVSGITLLGNETITGTLKVTGVTNLNNNLTVNGVTIINNSLTSNSAVINGNTSISGILITTGVTTIYGATNLKNILNVTGTTTHYGALNVNSSFSANSLDISGNVTVGGTLIVTGNTTFFNPATFNSSVSILSLYVSNNTSLYGTLFVSGSTSLNSNLYAYQNEYLTGNLYITGSTNLYNTLSLYIGNAKFYNNVYITGSTYLGDVTSGATQQNFTVIDNTTKKLANSGLKFNVYGSDFDYIQDLTSTSTTLVTPNYATKITLSTSTIPAGTYKITASAQVNKTTNAADLYIRIQVDGSNLGNIMQLELSDSSSWVQYTKVLFITFLTTTTHTITLQYSQESAGTTNIRDASLEIIRTS
jgi:hypothetical protein